MPIHCTMIYHVPTAFLAFHQIIFFTLLSLYCLENPKFQLHWFFIGILYIRMHKQPNTCKCFIKFALVFLNMTLTQIWWIWHVHYFSLIFKKKTLFSSVNLKSFIKTGKKTNTPFYLLFYLCKSLLYKCTLARCK